MSRCVVARVLIYGMISVPLRLLFFRIFLVLLRRRVGGWEGARGVERKPGVGCCPVFKGALDWVCQEEEEVAAFRSSFRSIVSPSHLELA